MLGSITWQHNTAKNKEARVSEPQTVDKVPCTPEKECMGFCYMVK